MKDTTKKSLAECKDEVAEKHGFENWRDLLIKFQGTDRVIIREQFDGMIDEAAELYASQFIKKDETISDKQIVDEIKLITDWPDVHDGPQNITVNTAIKLVRKFQSTQQPAIEWLNETEVYQFAYQQVYKHMPEHDRETNKQLLTEQMDLINKVQSKLKERVNCVDVLDLINWIHENARKGYDKDVWFIGSNLSPIQLSTSELIQHYLTSKTKNDERE